MAGGFDRRNVRLKLISLEKACLKLAERYKAKGLGQQESDLRWMAIWLEKVRQMPVPERLPKQPTED